MGDIVSDLPERGKNKKWFPGIDSIRFILAMIVFLFHLENPFGTDLSNSTFTIYRYIGAFFGICFPGLPAVISFFIVSGFVIHYPNKSGIKNIRRFLVRRIVRILFPLIVILLLGIPFGGPESSVVWSLYCEIIFYFLYPILFYIKTSWKGKLKFALVISIVITCVLGRNDIISLLKQTNFNYQGEIWQLGTAFTWLYGLTFWLIGVNLADRIDEITKMTSYKKLWFVRIFILFLAMLSSFLRYHFFVSNLVSMLFIAIPINSWMEMEICFYRSRKPFALLEKGGKFSYSLYLSHPLIVAILLPLLKINKLTYFIYIIITLFVSYVFYLVLEKPSHRFAQILTAI